MSLAKERGIKDVLIDERRGRNVALREGLFPIPTLAVLERGAVLQLLDLPASLAALEKTTIRLPADLIAAALARDAARKHNQQIKPP